MDWLILFLSLLPLSNRQPPNLGELAQPPYVIFSGVTSINDATLYITTNSPYEVPAHYECSNPKYAVVWKHTVTETSNSWAITCEELKGGK